MQVCQIVYSERFEAELPIYEYINLATNDQTMCKFQWNLIIRKISFRKNIFENVVGELVDIFQSQCVNEYKPTDSGSVILLTCGLGEWM